MHLFRFILGLSLLPLCVVFVMAGLELLASLGTGSNTLLPPEARWVLGGQLAWLGVWFFLPQPVRAYVIAHELTHALWGVFCGARVRDLRVSARGGSVSLSKSNLLITLAPYFFPFYTALVVLLRWLTALCCEPLPLPGLWLFLVGFTWTFHLCFTLQSLMIRQPDILEYGRLFSYTFIFLLNLATLLLWLVCTTPATLSKLIGTLLSCTAGVYNWLGQLILHLVTLLKTG